MTSPEESGESRTPAQLLAVAADQWVTDTSGLRQIIEVIYDLLTRTDPDQIRQVFCERTREVGDAEVAKLMEPDPRRSWLEETAHADVWPAREVLRVRTPLNGSQPSVCLLSWHSGEPQTVEDTLTDTRVSSQVAAGTGVRSLLAQPVTTPERQMGVLMLGWRQPGRQSPRVQALMPVLAAAAAAVIDRADLLTKLAAAAETDPLTGLGNRRAWREQAPRLLAHASRGQHTLACLVLDLDDFKTVNDTLGHQHGDRLLVESATAWSAALRQQDLLVRLGGDEFAALLPGADGATAWQVARRLCAVTPDPATSSAGLAVYRPSESADDLLDRADRDLYAHKRGCAKNQPPGPGP